MLLPTVVVLALSSLDGGAEQDIANLDLDSLLDTPIAAVSRAEEKSSDAPGDLFVVSREDLERHGFRSLDEVLRFVPGLFADDDTLYEGVGIHGLHLLGDNNTRILVLLDGHPLNNQVGTGQSYLGRDLPVTMSALERVEVIRGPVGGIYGPTAYFGVVNLVTKGAAQQGGEVLASGELAQSRPNAGELALNYGREVGGVRFALHGGFYRSRGFDYTLPIGDRPVPADGVIRDADWRQAWNLYGTADWKGFWLRSGFSDRRRGLPTAPYSVIPGDLRTDVVNTTFFAEAGYQRQLTDWAHLQARLSYDDFQYRDDLAYPAPPPTPFLDLASDRWLSAEVRATFTPRADHKDVVGVQVEQHFTTQHSFYEGVPSMAQDPVNGVGVDPIVVNFTTVNVSALVEQRLFERLKLQAGLTLFAHSLFGARLTPKLSVVWNAGEHDVVKAVYTEGFRPPTAFEAYFADGLDFVPNPELRAEGARAVQGVWEHRFLPQLAFTLRGHADHFEGLIAPRTVPAPGLDHEPMMPSDYRQQYANTAAVNVAGGEAGLSAAFEPYLRGWAGVSVQGADFQGAPTSNFAPWLFNAAVSTRAVHPSLTVAARATYVDRRTVDLASTTSEPATVDPYFWVDFSVLWEVPWVKGLAAQGTLVNLFDVVAFDPLVADHAPLTRLRKTPREARLTLRYSF